MWGRFDTIRARILIGLALLLAGLIATAIAGAATLRQMRYAIDQELDALRTSTEVGSGLVTSVLEEIRAAEQYLGSPGDDPRREFQAAAEEAFQHQRRLDGLGGLTVEDRLTVNRVKQLHATIQTEYSIAHALRDLGRDQEAAARAAAVRPQAAELTRLVRDLSQRQAQKAAKVAQRLSADAADRERKLWVFVVALVIAGFFLSRYTVQSVHGPLGRLVTAAERFGAGDLRPVTTGEMPREFRVLADAIQQMGNRLRQIVGDVIGESDRIAGAAGDLSAVSEELAASSSEVSTAMVEISGGADQTRRPHLHGHRTRCPSRRHRRHGGRGGARGEARRGDPHGSRPAPGRRRRRRERAAQRAGGGADHLEPDQPARRAERVDRRLRGAHQAHLVADQPAGVERGDRSGTGR